MRSDSKTPELWTVVNWRQYIEFVWSRMSWWHKRNFIKVKCLECWKVSEIEAKWLWNFWCSCKRIKEKKRTKHWLAHDRFYSIYRWMLWRCKYKNLKRYHLYWWRWIKVLRNSFEDFKNDMYDSYLKHIEVYWVKDTTIDRIDSNDNYYKENCRRATVQEQNFNKRTTNFVKVWDKTITAVELSKMCNISINTASWRISKYLVWKIPYSNLVLIWNHKNIKLIVNIDWENYDTHKVSEIAWINLRNSRQRLRRYIDWKISKEELLKYNSKVSSPYTSIYPPATATASNG